MSGQKQAEKPVEAVTKFMGNVAARKTSFQRLLPKGMDAEWFLAEVRVAVARNMDLMRCDPVSVFDALTTCAQLGLSPSGRLGSAYLIPFRDNKAKQGAPTHRVTLVVGYRGMVDLAYRSGEVVGFGAQVVHENEPFDVREGFDIEILKHDRDVSDPGALRAVYAWAELRGGFKVRVLMWAREVLAIKARSSASTGPWQSDEAEMWKKTALRRLVKLLPLSPQKAQGLSRAIEAEDAEWEDAPIDAPDVGPTGMEGLKAAARQAKALPEDSAATQRLEQPRQGEYADASNYKGEEPPEDWAPPGGGK